MAKLKSIQNLTFVTNQLTVYDLSTYILGVANILTKLIYRPSFYGGYKNAVYSLCQLKN